MAIHWHRIIYLLSVTGLIIVCIFAAFGIRVYRHYTIPSKDDIMNRNDTGMVLLDRHDTPFFAFGRSRPRTFIPLSSIPLSVQQALVAVEDKEFYSHHGFSPHAIARSLYLDLKYGRWLYGGSTLTQQLVKNSLLNNRKSIQRKVQELIIAVKLEQHFSKADILEMYLNSAYFGKGVFGIEEASQAYFNKGAKALTLGEAALLIGLLPAPSNLEPKAVTGQKQRLVLEQMVKQGFVTRSIAQAALNEPIKLSFQEKDINVHAPHFALMVRDQLIKMYGEESVMRAGVKVRTTLDLAWQKYAQAAVARQVATLASGGATNGAAVVIDPTNGAVKALVGSINWFTPGFGTANMAAFPRQTGSAFKPIVYAAALANQTITASTILQDSPRNFGSDRFPYTPEDYDRHWRGPVLVRRALANSLNVPAVEVLSRTGVARVADLARSFGISTIRPVETYNLSLALGAESISPVELTGAYATFASGGVRHSPTFFTAVHDKYNREVIFTQPAPQPVVSSQVAFLISSILSDNRARAEIFGTLLTISRPAAVKTGTSQDYRDSWTVGYVPQLAVGVWIGNNNNAPMTRLPGSIGAAPLWRDLMEHFTQGLPIQDFEPPIGVVKAPVCSSGSTEYFIAGTEPNGGRACPSPSVLPQISPQSSSPPPPQPKPSKKPSSNPALVEL